MLLICSILWYFFYSISFLWICIRVFVCSCRMSEPHCLRGQYNTFSGLSILLFCCFCTYLNTYLLDFPDKRPAYSADISAMAEKIIKPRFSLQQENCCMEFDLHTAVLCLFPLKISCINQPVSSDIRICLLLPVRSWQIILQLFQDSVLPESCNELPRSGIPDSLL